MMANSKKDIQQLSSSFRDPEGFLFRKNGILYRKINQVGIKNYKILMSSGLYDNLTKKEYLVSHEDVQSADFTDHCSIVIKPRELDFVSYPYEWCFSQLKDAALLTLKIMRESISYGIILKDASAYNIQFQDGKPLFIDTGSFEEYFEGSVWKGYNQFCRHFLAPLSLIAMGDVRLCTLSKQHIDGIPLDFASKLLPLSSWLKYSIFAHIHLHAKAQKRFEHSKDGIKRKNKINMSRNKILGLIDSLVSAINSINLKEIKTEWCDYYNNTNYSDIGFKHKSELIEKFITKINPKTVWDLGGNNGYFSQIAINCGASVICWDIDPVAVEKNYRNSKMTQCKILPLLIDLTNPSPNLGWAHKERLSLQDRGPVDMIMALGLIHHLAISNNVPLVAIAEYFSKLSKFLIIEFIAKNDSKIEYLLSTREDIFNDYHIDGFIKAFNLYYDEIDRININDTSRTLFLMSAKK